MRDLVISFHDHMGQRLTIGLPEGVVNGHPVRPQGRLVVHLRAGLCEFVCFHHGQLCPISKEHVSLKQAYSKGMRDDGAATSYCLPVTKKTHVRIIPLLPAFIFVKE